jgi:hypothetical protein
MNGASADSARDDRALPGVAPRAKHVHRYRSPFVALGLAAFALAAAFDAGAAPQTKGSGQSVYKWVDANGVTHYGDAIPSEHAGAEKTVLNEQGVPVRTIPGRRTPEQLEADALRRDVEKRAQQELTLARQRDQNLLATYLTAEEIEALRDRRLEAIQAQSKVTTQYIETLRARLRQYEQQAQRHSPYNADSKAGPLPEHLANDLVRTVNELRAQEANLASKRQETALLQEQFGRDITRFRELKKIQSDYVRSTQPRS